ncbi:hypothetical protein BDN71DRAFT_1428290 [Pleurotus eryngii]|uniref:Uncharacterized protein n=1 Tax=Pleurotus eryngii TaxID=5323 RepID=A0A9P6DIP4_PLEER|nr:hypothetical protein BDN71DRAFT_1428290 [Pleurotus eryngii]
MYHAIGSKELYFHCDQQVNYKIWFHCKVTCQMDDSVNMQYFLKDSPSHSDQHNRDGQQGPQGLVKEYVLRNKRARVNHSSPSTTVERAKTIGTGARMGDGWKEYMLTSNTICGLMSKYSKWQSDKEGVCQEGPVTVPKDVLSVQAELGVEDCRASLQHRHYTLWEVRALQGHRINTYGTGCINVPYIDEETGIYACQESDAPAIVFLPSYHFLLPSCRFLPHHGHFHPKAKDCIVVHELQLLIPRALGHNGSGKAVAGALLHSFPPFISQLSVGPWSKCVYSINTLLRPTHT